MTRSSTDADGAGVQFEPMVMCGSDADAPGLRDDLLRTWVDVSNAGGAVGFVPPTSDGEVAPVLDRTLCRVRDGLDDLVVVRLDRHAGSPSGSPARPTGPSLPEGLRYVAMAVLADGGSPLTAHWRTVIRVMVHPAVQGSGVGGLLMDAVHRHARGSGLDHLVLLVRTGQGIEPFYERLGYLTIGRHPRAIAVTSDDVRDEVMMHRPLEPSF